MLFKIKCHSFLGLLFISLIACNNKAPSDAVVPVENSQVTEVKKAAKNKVDHSIKNAIKLTSNKLSGNYYLSASHSGISEADAIRTNVDQTYFAFRPDKVVVNHVNTQEFPGNYEVQEDMLGISLSFGSMRLNFDVSGDTLFNKAVIDGNKNTYIKR